MSMIHQIYCTHCTHGSSALERREGSLAHRMLGYSARAGSMDVQDLRKFYRQIERYAYYYLPRDTPAEEKLRLTASTAPRRLIYLPSTSGLQLTGQICYRQTDTEGRPGSYFAHVLFRDEKDGQPRWSTLDCLKLWGSPGWVEEDSATIPFRLQPLGSFAEMLRGRRPAIDDGVFLSFLAAPAGGAWDDPAGVIPLRWRQMTPGRRAALFVEAFSGFLEISAARRESLLLIAEPSAAALIFYGIARLLPAGEIRETLSYSTFEPNPDRVSTTLAATWFHDPQKGDVRADALRDRGTVLNTCVERRAEARRPASIYVQNIVQRLVEGGWPAVDQRLRNLESVGARRIEDLNGLAAVDRMVPVLLDPQLTLPNEDWRRSQAATEYLRKAVARRLAELVDIETVLEPLVGRPNQLLILELTAVEPAVPGTRDAAEFLLKRLPGEKIADLLALPGISLEDKLGVLARYVAGRGDLPPGCEGLWHERTQSGQPGQDLAGLLPRLLARLPEKSLEAFYRGGGEQHVDAFLFALVEACRQNPSRRKSLTQIVGGMNDEALLSMWRNRGPTFFKEYPDDEPALGGRLREIVCSLPEHVAGFSDRLDLVLAGRHLLPDDASQNMATAWANCRQAILDLGRLQEPKATARGRRAAQEMEGPARRLAESAARAMPSGQFDDDAHGTRKKDRLRRIGHRLLGKPLLPAKVWLHEAAWQKISWFFEMNSWPSAPLEKLHRKRGALRRVAIIGAFVAMAGVVYSLFHWLPPRGRQAPPSRAAATPQPPPSPPGKATPEPKPEVKLPAPKPPEPKPEVKRPEPKPPEPKPPAPRPERPVPSPKEEKTAPTEKKPPQVAATPAAKAESPFSETEGPKLPKSPEASQEAQAEQRWRKQARESAAEHGGVFLERAPLRNGRCEISAAEFPAPPKDGQVSLIEGRLYLDKAAYPFSADPAEDPPTTTCDVPRLAEERGLASVSVTLEQQEGRLLLIVAGRGKPQAGDATAELKENQKQRAALRQKLLSKRMQWKKTAISEQQDVIRDELFNLMEVKLPTVPPRPSRDEPKFKEMDKDPNKASEFKKAMQAHDDAAAKKADLLSRVEALTVEKIRSLGDQIDEIEKELKRLRRAPVDDSDPGIRELKASCRSISALIHVATDALRDTTAGAEKTPTVEPPPAASTSGSGLPVIEGQLDVQSVSDPSADNRRSARIKLKVHSAAGVALPAWLSQKCNVTCVLTWHRKSGPEFKSVPDVLKKSAFLEVPEDTSRIDVRLDFFSKLNGGHDGDLPRIATTNGLSVDRVEGGKQYALQFQIAKEGMDELKRILTRPNVQ